MAEEKKTETGGICYIQFTCDDDKIQEIINTLYAENQKNISGMEFIQTRTLENMKEARQIAKTYLANGGHMKPRRQKSLLELEGTQL